MNEVQRCKVERIIRQVFAENKDKNLNEIKKIVKDKIRIKKGNQREIEENMKLISEIDFEFFERTITDNKSSRKQSEIEYVIDEGRIALDMGRNR